MSIKMTHYNSNGNEVRAKYADDTFWIASTSKDRSEEMTVFLNAKEVEEIVKAGREWLAEQGNNAKTKKERT